MTPIYELIRLVAERESFTLVVESGELWRIVLFDANHEIRGEGHDFEAACLDLQLIETDPMATEAHCDAAVSQMLNMAAIWTDIEMARIEADRAPSRSDQAAYRAWLMIPDPDEILRRK